MREPIRPVIASKQSPVLRAKFVGSADCATCHERENSLWRGSHHQLAMQPAANSTVLGDFNNASFSNDGITSTFFRRDSKFMVRTDGPDGALQGLRNQVHVWRLTTAAISDRHAGRTLAGARNRMGQPPARARWSALVLSLSRPENLVFTSVALDRYRSDLELHVCGLPFDQRAQELRTADAYLCHQLCRDRRSLRGLSRSRIESRLVGAEARRLAKLSRSNHGLTIALDERNGVSWPVDSAGNTVHRSRPRESEREIQMCARCHSRRGEIYEEYVHGQPVGDDYRVALLDQDLYFPDGQIKGEVYEYGSFVQSRMFHAGVTCSDCHEPHSLKLRADGNNVCLQCHSAPKYDSAKHHFHQKGIARRAMRRMSYADADLHGH